MYDCSEDGDGLDPQERSWARVSLLAAATSTTTPALEGVATSDAGAERPDPARTTRAGRRRRQPAVTVHVGRFRCHVGQAGRVGPRTAIHVSVIVSVSG